MVLNWLFMKHKNLLKINFPVGANLFQKGYTTEGYGDFEKVIEGLPDLKTYDPDLQVKGKYQKAMDIDFLKKS